MPLIGGMRLARDFLPLAGIERRKKGIACQGSVHLGQFQRSGLRQKLRIQFATAYHHDLGLVRRGGQCSSHRGKDFRATSDKAGLAGNHEIASPGKRSAEAVPGSPAHQDGLAQGECLEVLKVCGQAPRQGACHANDAVVANGGNEG